MPPTADDRMQDIIDSIAEIEKLLAGLDRDRFEAEKTIRMASERYLEIVCEATRKLPDHIKEQAHDIEWQKIVDFGNRLRHAYHATDVDIVWNIVQIHLPRLKEFVSRRIV